MQRSLKNLAALAVLLGCVAALGYIDYVTGTEIRSAVFYVVPIAGAAWLLSRRHVVIVVLASGLAWALAQYYEEEWLPFWILAWNEFAALVIFALVGALVSGFKRERDRARGLLEREREMARTDPLTGLANSRAFRERLQTDADRALRDGQPLCLLYLDLDNFKKVNDRYGHGAGDEALRAIAQAMRAGLRATDMAARMGGDEFVALLWRASAAEAHEVGERMRQVVAGVAAKYPQCGLDASVGIAWFESPSADIDRKINRADEAMYEAKQQKGRVVVVSIARDPGEVSTQSPQPASA
ncbi:MAG: GGDEF domain-containing protein [Planctomycetes bacterium]|nr:GGDEF domain-containing protein [Planctomycetota bacterium]MCW8136728.1 GGDEF domain-containing protein [Planctomycetota bacterium]